MNKENTTFVKLDNNTAETILRIIILGTLCLCLGGGVYFLWSIRPPSASERREAIKKSIPNLGEKVVLKNIEVKAGDFVRFDLKSEQEFRGWVLRSDEKVIVIKDYRGDMTTIDKSQVVAETPMKLD